MLKPGGELGPFQTIQGKETEHLLLCFCTFCSLLKGKKLSYQNIFLLLLKEKRLRDLVLQSTGKKKESELKHPITHKEIARRKKDNK